jgi:hypothetical protein
MTMALDFSYKNFRDFPGWDQVIDPITDEEVEAWVANLRSGKYLQGEGALTVWEYIYKSPKGETFERKYVKPHNCCLGVLQDQCNLDKVDADAGTLYTHGFDYLKLPSGLQDELAVHNDGGATFKQIARAIEKGFGLKAKKNR